MFATSRWQPSLPNEGSYQHFNNHSDDPWTFITFPSCDDHARIIETSRGLNRKVIWTHFFSPTTSSGLHPSFVPGINTNDQNHHRNVWLCQENIASNQLELPIVPPSSNPQKTRGQIPVVNPPPFRKTCYDVFPLHLKQPKNNLQFSGQHMKYRCVFVERLVVEPTLL